MAGPLHSALQDAAKTIAEMPARYLKYPKGGVVFPVEQMAEDKSAFDHHPR